MYKYLLCWRYLRTKYIAIASIISVMLGVATLIVVNSVMSGFNAEMTGRLHGIFSDVVFKSRSFDGFENPELRMEQIRRVAGDQIAAMTPTVEVPSMLYYKFGNSWISHPVRVIGIDPETYPQVSKFSEYLQHPENRRKLNFTLRENGYDVRDHQLEEGADFVPRDELGGSGWQLRRAKARCEKFTRQIDDGGQVRHISPPALEQKMPEQTVAEQAVPVLAPYSGRLGSSKHAEANPDDPMGHAVAADTTDTPAVAKDLFGVSPFEQAEGEKPSKTFDPEFQQRRGIILGMSIASFRDRDGEDRFHALPGDDVNLVIPSTSQPPKPISDSFTVVDLYESKMSEFDEQLVFVPIKYLQQLRGMVDPGTGVSRVNQIQIKLKPGVDPVAFRDTLQAKFDPRFFAVLTWMDIQAPLLKAVEMERAILNVLLFLIVAVAGFGILAIFWIIVLQKYRDIGILKSLGASKSGIMGIFLIYGALLGVVGSLAGIGLGLLIVENINVIADWIGRIRGEQIFDPSIYYFYSIPTIIDPMMIVQVVLGTLLIALLASMLPALRAATLHPVEALRHE